MNCERTKEQLVDYLSSQLSSEEQAALQAHLAECADCREELQAVQGVWQTLGKVRVPEPSEHIRTDFYAMLGTFRESAKPAPDYSLKGLWQWWLELQVPLPLLRLVYSACLVGVGLIGGYWLNGQRTSTQSADQQEVAALAAQVGQMRQVMMLALIENPSATKRLKAVNYTKELEAPTARVVEALLSTLNHDDNVNVRLATLEALTPLAQDPTVRLGLVRALKYQDSPLVQTALADAMVQLQDPRSVKPLRELLKQDNLEESVKSKIEQSIQTLSNGRSAEPITPPSNDQTLVSPQPQHAAFVAV
ncbi:HEAT repeat domain-containing protein [Hymenobacter arizonensis]|uniref:Putative zinc-finger n=1 Tax=Hymenobacter arizonensis TaxID=1227077 RepID=A0A1I5ZQ66_HYMAR|nr:HEAT repeat domain-containing protein [Hymenobacter arizonensis]SFQ58634.1 Putative zinc-finger [Hymenobacter arizonensis]